MISFIKSLFGAGEKKTLKLSDHIVAVGVIVLIAGPFAKLAAYAAIGYGAWTIWKSE